MLQKCVNPYKYIDNWEKSGEISIPEKEYFYSGLNMGDITDTDYGHATAVWKEFEIKKLGKYHNLFAWKDIVLKPGAFQNFMNMCLDPARFLTEPGSAW